MILDSDQNICYIFVMKNENTFEMIFFLSEKDYIANWTSLSSAENMFMFVRITAYNHQG